MDGMTRTLMMVALAAAAGSLSAFAQDGSPSLNDPMRFATLDQDGNGIVSEYEFDRVQARSAGAGTQASTYSFGAMDTNGDGQLSADEVANASPARQRRGPGMVPGGNRPPGQDSLGFADFDENGDERISENELYRARAARLVERAQRGDPTSNLPNEPTFGQMDLNGDALIDRQEFAVAERRQPQPQAAKSSADARPAPRPAPTREDSQPRL
ncbi:EF-hand domain-containing protein [Thiocystis violacea]|uniref:EF-hand domain-containing protein n=1 Tax=Thiocystis violacea TaxID=13725 RepID=UPI001908293C|nr:hypothetical protein [Thiocystis violacea]MBK1721489.1 hypothetical protein [Thiocystis violacea]